MPDDNIQQIEIEREMEDSFLEYAMSVIVSRALPDVRDGLKPVHRRILFSMYDAGIRPGTPFRKCARVVGDVMGWFHPHSQDAIYDALVRLGQDFSTRYTLVEPQGNFGSVDDGPAAMRYTETRMTAAGHAPARRHQRGDRRLRRQLLRGAPAADRAALPFPNLLVNGSTGIAVGMATNIPPHNLAEVVDACLHALDDPEATAEDLIQFVKGPDFPTGGYIVGTGGISDALLTGRGSVKMRAVADVQEIKKGRMAIVVTEIPYQVSIQRIMERIADLVNNKTISGISDIRDESNRHGIRIVVELKREANPQVILNQLFKSTGLRRTSPSTRWRWSTGCPGCSTWPIWSTPTCVTSSRWSCGAPATGSAGPGAGPHPRGAAGRPRQHRRGGGDHPRVGRRRGGACGTLMSRFELSEIQANHILDMPLRRLTALETEKLREEHAELMDLIAELESILASEPRGSARGRRGAHRHPREVRRRPALPDHPRRGRHVAGGPHRRRGPRGEHHRPAAMSRRCWPGRTRPRAGAAEE